MSAESVTVVKWGGAVITRKSALERVRAKILHRLAVELADAPGPVILLHGAGSFGHPSARRFGLAGPPDPSRPPTERSRGASIVSAEVRRLHAHVIRALLGAGLRPWSVPAAMVAGQEAGRLVRFDGRPFVDALARHQVPVSFGDVVPDATWGTSILSADTIALALVQAMPVRRVVFVSDVAGVYEPGPPGRPRVIPTLDRAVLDRLSPAASGPDVTGGIRGKVAAMLAIAGAGADAALISGLSGGALSRVLRGESVYGSWSKAVPG